MASDFTAPSLPPALAPSTGPLYRAFVLCLVLPRVYRDSTLSYPCSPSHTPACPLLSRLPRVLPSIRLASVIRCTLIIRTKYGEIRTFCRFMFPYFFPHFVRISIEKCQNTAFLVSQRLTWNAGVGSDLRKYFTCAQNEMEVIPVRPIINVSLRHH